MIDVEHRCLAAIVLIALDFAEVRKLAFAALIATAAGMAAIALVDSHHGHPVAVASAATMKGVVQ